MNALHPGPIWHNTVPGTRVRPKCRRKQGEVVAVLEETPDGTPTQVRVVWDHGHPYGEQWASDCLVLLEVPEVPEDPLVAGFALSALPRVLLDYRLELESMRREQDALQRIWSAAQNSWEEVEQVAKRLDLLDVKIAITTRLIDRLRAELQRRAS